MTFLFFSVLWLTRLRVSDSTIRFVLCLSAAGYVLDGPGLPAYPVGAKQSDQVGPRPEMQAGDHVSTHFYLLVVSSHVSSWFYSK